MRRTAVLLRGVNSWGQVSTTSQNPRRDHAAFALEPPYFLSRLLLFLEIEEFSLRRIHVHRLDIDPTMEHSKLMVSLFRCFPKCTGNEQTLAMGRPTGQS